MVRTLLVRVVSAAIFGVVIAASAAAQPRAAEPPRMNPGDLRHHIYVMEGALARAVQFGAQQVNREMRTFSPDMFALAGQAQARGVYLDDYGVFFDVGVPILRQSMMWSFRTILEQDERNTRATIAELRRMLGSLRDMSDRRTIEASIAQLESTLPDNSAAGPVVAQPGTVGAAMLPPEGPTPSKPAQAQPQPRSETPRIVADRPVIKDPNRAYTDAVQRALIDAMIDFSAPILLAPNEWLTVAARDNEPRDSFAPQDPYDEVVTILLRIKGEDLAAYRTGRIDRDEAKRRVQLREF